MGTRSIFPPNVTGSWDSSISWSKVDCNFLSSTKTICTLRKHDILEWFKEFDSKETHIIPEITNNYCRKLLTSNRQEQPLSYIQHEIDHKMLYKPFHLFLCVFVDKRINHLPCSHEYVRNMNNKQFAQPLRVTILSIKQSVNEWSQQEFMNIFFLIFEDSLSI